MDFEIQDVLLTIGAGWNTDTIASIESNLEITTIDAKSFSFLTLSQIFENLEKYPWRLIILDTSLGFPGYDAYYTKEVVSWVSRLESLAIKTGAAVLGVYDSNTVHQHVTYRARWGAEVENLQWSEKDEFERKTGRVFDEAQLSEMYRFKVFKANYAPPNTHTVWYEKLSSTLLVPARFD